MKKAIIIGSTSGIGKELAWILSNNDYQVGITGRRMALLEELQDLKPESIKVLQMDITEISLLNDKLERLKIKLGGLDLLIICSGIGELNPDLNFNLEKITIDTNVIGFTCIADWAFNYFSTQNAGHLVGISSLAGLRGNRIAPAYNATKAFQINYLEGLRQKAYKMKSSITVTDVRPGFVDTAMAKGDGQFWVASPQKAAKQIFDAIKRKRNVVYVTKRWSIIALLLKFLPRILYNKM